MADNEIQGRAKKFDGAAIDYVSIFNWDNGTCIAQTYPDASGNWKYQYNTNLEVGITYVADGCEPITHGPYSFIHTAVVPKDYILSYKFNGNLLDNSVNALNGIKTGTANFVTGRKVGTQALSFVSGGVRTAKVLPINNDKITISFWINTVVSNTESIVFETSVSTNTNLDAVAGILNHSTSILDVYHRSNTANKLTHTPITLDGTYQHVLIEIDKSKDANNEQKVYINNGANSASLDNDFAGDATGVFANHVIYIGQRSGGIAPFVGKLQDFKVYNRILSASERTALFNE